jgi:FAD/FMN-containing dehydrogenase
MNLAGLHFTNKFLDGLPGIQKEGCDGFITSAQFILPFSFGHCIVLLLRFTTSDYSFVIF